MSGFLYWLLLWTAIAVDYPQSDAMRKIIVLALVTGSLPCVFLAFRAIRRQSRAEAAALALKDDLTGLPNRAYFMDQLEKALARAARQDRHVAVLFMDLDRFKMFNDTMGHAAGDKLIMEIGRRVRRQVRSGETFARLGGDEFTVLLEGITEIGQAEIAAQRILTNVGGSVLIEGHEVFVSASIGIAMSTGQHCPPDELVRRADVALYQAKADGRSCYRVFEQGQSSLTIDRLQMDSDLRAAIDRRELRVYYQPEVDLASGEVVGFEALVRWQSETRGLLLPGAFLPEAEEAGLMPSIGRWVLREACFEASRWKARTRDGKPLVVSVNVAPEQFRKRELISDVVGVLKETGIDPAQLRLEIVETALMQDTEATIETLALLHELGVKIAIDDFGAGYSSFNYLRSFPVDTLKIDRMFISEMAADTRTIAVIECIISLAHLLGMRVVAEGVETSDQLKSILKAECDFAQGFLFARPLPADAVAPFVASRPGASQPPPAAPHGIGVGLPGVELVAS
jgi:diguanylate cyclase (GGDEF)-like protein